MDVNGQDVVMMTKEHVQAHNPGHAKRPLDRFVICRAADTVMLPDQLCPRCGKPLMLVGRKTLGMPVDRKAYCEYCPFEEEF